MNNRLHTPDGVRDYLPDDLTVKIIIERKLEMVFRRYGYLPVSSPMFEYMEVFEGTGGVTPEKMYKFLDRDGSILSLRPDMTPSIARIAATAYNTNDIPLRFCYFENAFRYNENYQGKLKEFTQAGIELIGVNSDDANAETIAVAVNSLIAAGLTDFRIDVGQTGFLTGILEESGFDEKTCRLLQNMVVDKEFTAVEEIISGSDISDNIKTLFLRLPFLIGGIEILDEARNLAHNQKSLDALTNIVNIYNILCCYGVERYIMFDLSMVGHLDYYTGLIFRGYTSGSGSSVLDGGRYDGLLSKFGAEYPAVGFAIKCNRLISAVQAAKADIEIQNTDTLIAFSIEGRAKALEMADVLRRSGLYIETSLLGFDFNINKAYAAKKNFGGMIYFSNDNDVIITDISKNTETYADIGELLQIAGTDGIE